MVASVSAVVSRSEELSTRQIRRAIVLAAGKGSRLAAGGIVPKTLQPVLGIPLLIRVLRTLELEGLREAVVVLGFADKHVRSALLDAALTIDLEFVTNPRFEAGNGLSVLAAREYLDEDCILSMGDHLYAPQLVRRVKNAPAPDGACVIGVDYELDRCLDIDEATKVRVEDGRVVAIGKALTDYHAIDTGVFRVGPSLIAALDGQFRRAGDCSLSDGVRALTERDQVIACDVEDTRWIDVDEPAAFRRAESLVRLYGDNLDSEHGPSLSPLADDEPAIRRLGGHEGKEIVLGYDRHVVPQVEALSGLLGEHGTVLSATDGQLHWIACAERVCTLVGRSPKRVGVLCCSTGIGMSIAANKFPGIYAARCLTVEDAQLARTINNANVLCLASRTPIEENRRIVEAFFTTQYEGRKLEQLESITRLELEQRASLPTRYTPPEEPAASAWYARTDVRR